MVVCGDSDTVVMALMLDPRANVTIDFGPRHGVLDTALLRQRWLLQPLLQAGLQLGPDPHVISGFTQVRVRSRCPSCLIMCAAKRLFLLYQLRRSSPSPKDSHSGSSNPHEEEWGSIFSRRGSPNLR